MKIKTNIKSALKIVNKEIIGNASSGGLYARGLSSEGYAGGYRDALHDVLLALDGIRPGRDYWRDWVDLDKKDNPHNFNRWDSVPLNIHALVRDEAEKGEGR